MTISSSILFRLQIYFFESKDRSWSRRENEVWSNVVDQVLQKNTPLFPRSTDQDWVASDCMVVSSILTAPAFSARKVLSKLQWRLPKLRINCAMYLYESRFVLKQHVQTQYGHGWEGCIGMAEVWNLWNELSIGSTDLLVGKNIRKGSLFWIWFDCGGCIVAHIAGASCRSIPVVLSTDLLCE